MLLEVNQPPLTDDNSVDSYVDGEEKFKALIDDIKKAKHHVHICYYIFRSDKLGTAIVDALEERAKNGVEVRVLFDLIGGRTIEKGFFDQLKAYGGQIEEAFGSRFLLQNIRLNYRNHRKIAVIDGEVGYVGGFNVGDDYLGEYEHMGYWRDTHLRMEGSAVHQLQQRFIIDWNASRKTELISYESTYFPTMRLKGDKLVQIVSSGPDSEDEAIKKGYLKMISIATQSIYIQSPYFIPDDAIKEALQVALLSGVKVRIMIPNKPDHPFVYQATLSYAEEMMNMGAEIYTYDKGFLHAKVLIIDDEITSVGTANFDIRSFKLNFEVNAFVYDDNIAKEHVSYYMDDVEESVLLTPEFFEGFSLWNRFKQQFSRLLSPIL
jgi:cardiolipin synthase